RVRIERALEGDLAQVRREETDDQEQISVARLRRDVELGGERPGDLGLALERRREEREAFAETGVAHVVVARQRLADETVIARIQVEPRPLSARQRPFALLPLDEPLTGMADLEQDPGLLRPSRVLALQEVAEELLLERHAVVCVEVRPVLDAVDFEPLLVRRR